MALLRKNTDYAVRALMELAVCEGGYVSSRAIADKHGLPYQFLRSIMQRLIRYGLVESKEGVRGGVRLSKNPKEIKIVDVIQIFQGDIELSNCLFQKKLCSNRSTCVLRKEIHRIESLVEKELGKLTIKGLIDKINRVSKGGR
jgi:Rrf2 family protein